MFDWEFLQEYPEFKEHDEDQLTLLPERMRPRPLHEIIKDDEELDMRVQSGKEKIPESPEAVVFSHEIAPQKCWFNCPLVNETVRVVDLTPGQMDMAMELILEHYVPTEPLCKAMRISEDQVGFREYTHQVEYFMKGEASFVALSPQGELIGVLVGKLEDVQDCTEKLVQKTDYQSNRLHTMYNLLNFLNRTVNVHEKYDCEIYYRIYIIAVTEDWKYKGIEKALITGAMIYCRYNNIPLIGGAYSLYKDQCFIEQFGGTKDFEVYFSEWRTNRGWRIFRGTGRAEPKIAWMTLRVEETFTPSIDSKATIPPLTTERARRIIQKRLPIWVELDILRPCQCLDVLSLEKTPSRKISTRKRQSQGRYEGSSQRLKDRVVFTS